MAYHQTIVFLATNHSPGHICSLFGSSLFPAQNIRDEGLRMLEVGHTSVASGERVRPSKGTDESQAFFDEGRISRHSASLTVRVSKSLALID
ncbi:MAG: hypothetical protein U7127_18975 [Phormidium sp.]